MSSERAWPKRQMCPSFISSMETIFFPFLQGHRGEGVNDAGFSFAMVTK